MKKIAFKQNCKERTAGLKPALWLARLLLGLSLLTSSIPVYSQTTGSEVRYEWVKQAGGIESFGIAVDTSGNNYITGDFRGTATFGSTTLTSAAGGEAFIAKLDTAGNFIWAKQSKTGNNGSGKGTGIAVDASGDSYITGSFKGNILFGSTRLTSSRSGKDINIFIAKLDAGGNFLWAKRVEDGGGDDYYKNIGAISKIATDASGGCYLTGHFVGTVTFGSTIFKAVGVGNTFIARLDATGNFLWAKQIVSGETQSTGITVDNSENCYVTGYLGGGPTAFGPIVLQNTVIGTNTFITKLDRNGNFLWATQVEGDNDNTGDYNISYGIAVDNSGNSYVTGVFNTTTATFGSIMFTGDGGMFITKLDASGKFLWAKDAARGPDNEGLARVEGLAIAVDALDNSYVMGNFSRTSLKDSYGTIIFGPDTLSSTSFYNTFITKLDAAGNFLWAKKIDSSYGTAGVYRHTSGIATDASGNCYVTGNLIGTATFDSITLAYDDGSIFICKLSEQQEDEGVSIAEHDLAGSIALLPNPFRQNIHLQIDLQKAANAAISVYDLSGRQVYHLEDQKLPEGKSTLTLSPAFESVPTGIYLVNVQLDNGEKWIRKVVKMM